MRKTPADNLIKGTIRSRFRSDCTGCSQYYACISCGNITKGLPEYILQARGYKIPQTEAMRKGKEMHEEILENLQTVEEYGIERLKNDLTAGKTIHLKEVKICSRQWGVKGIVDDLEIRLDGNNFHAHITELKSSYWKNYLYQMAGYAVIMSNPNFEICFTVKGKKKDRVVGIPLLPNIPININLKTTLYIMNQNRRFTTVWMTNGKMSKFGFGMMNSIWNKLKTKRKYHKTNIYDIESMMNEGSRQMYLGLKKPIVKNRPRIYQKVGI
jgi:hypothetical protein